MGLLSKVEDSLDGAVDRTSAAVFRGPIEPAQIAKRAAREMRRGKMVGQGRQYAPTLYTVFVNPADDKRLFSFYGTLASEIETYLIGEAAQNKLEIDGNRPLVRFVADDSLKKSGKFTVVAQVVSANIIRDLRKEEQEYLNSGRGQVAGPVGLDEAPAARVRHAQPAARAVSLPHGQSVSPAAAPVTLANARPTKAGRRGRSTVSTAIAHLTDVRTGQRYAIRTVATTIGRSSASDIMIQDANASRQHAKISSDGAGGWRIDDLGSTNGTILNGAQVGSAILHSGDNITIGTTQLTFSE
ncbi:MAG: FHA domain-containing protein [Coriobacteriales bacterium]|jgi:hypothetical protein|nr:FHA domain-containing protein [Coriobacteriales bacterium]